MIKGRPPRLSQIFQSYDAPLFFVTVCTLHRHRFSSLKTANDALVVYGTRAIEEFNVALGRYVIMPDHLHFFVRGDQNFVLGNWVKGEGTQASDIEGLSERKRSLPLAARFFRSLIVQ